MTTSIEELVGPRQIFALDFIEPKPSFMVQKLLKIWIGVIAFVLAINIVRSSALWASR